MSFGDHLDELRRRVLWALAIPIPLCFVTFFLSNPLVELLYLPLDRVLTSLDLPRRLQALGPAEVLVIKMKLSLIVALVLSGPWILWQAWLFVRPGLYRHERRFVHFLVPGSAVLTATGVVLMYYVMLPLMLQVLIMFGSSMRIAPNPGPAADPRIEAVLADGAAIETRLTDPVQPKPGDVWFKWPEGELRAAVERAGDDGTPGAGGTEIIVVKPPGPPLINQEFRLTTYINFVLILMLGIVIAFQMPLVILLMGWLGILTAQELRARRKYAIFICGVAAAVITPPDALSMIMMMVPLLGLYELSIVLMVLVPASAVAEGNVWRRRTGDRTGR